MLSSQTTTPDYQKIITAIKKHSAETVQTLIEEMKADVNYVDANGNSLLHIAAQHGKLKTLKLLLKLGAIQKSDTDGLLPFHSAIQYNHPKLIEFFVNDLKVDPSLPANNESGCFPLHIAAGYGSIDAMKMLCSLGSVYCKDKNGEFPIHRAAEFNQARIIEYLINIANKDQNQIAENETEYTPLHTAAKHGRVEAAKKLIELKAEHRLSEWEYHPIHTAARFGQVKFLEFLIVKAGIDCNVLGGERKETPLHAATEWGQLETVKLLIKFGAVHRPNYTGRFPIHLATINERFEVIHYLAQLDNTIVNLQTEGIGISPLQFCAIENLIQVAKTLFALGAEHLSDKNGEFPLHEAASRNHKDFIVFLVKEKGINVNLQTEYGDTALHIAAKVENFETVKLLYSLGAKHLPNKSECYPLHLAAQRDNPALVRFFVKKMQADVNADYKPYSFLDLRSTALEQACLYKNIAVVAELIRLKAKITIECFSKISSYDKNDNIQHKLFDLLLANSSTDFLLKNSAGLQKSFYAYNYPDRWLSCFLAHNQSITNLGHIEGEYMLTKKRGYAEIEDVVIAYKILQPIFEVSKAYLFAGLPVAINDLILKCLLPPELKTLPFTLFKAQKPTLPAKQFASKAEGRAHFFQKLKQANSTAVVKPSELVVVTKGNKRFMVDARYLHEVTEEDKGEKTVVCKR